jgi:serine/threonine-protein kinase
VKVVDVRGQTLDAARKAIQDQGLVPDEQGVLNETVPVNNVWEQQPAPGTEMKQGEKVVLVYNPGKGTVNLPNLKGQTQQAAEATITGLGLTADVVPLQSDTAAGLVLDQNPQAGPVETGSKVTLTVSSGAGQVPVPNVVGLDQVTAAAQLAAKGFQVTTTQEANDTVAAGKVIRTDPTANTPADSGASVTMVVSTGPAPVAVPNVEGLTESAARDTLQAAGFQQIVKSQDVPFGSDQNGKVISQTPAGGTKLAKGSPVTLIVGHALPPPTTTTTLPPTTRATTTTTSTTTTTTTAPTTTAAAASATTAAP